MKKNDFHAKLTAVHRILPTKPADHIQEGIAFAPVNIALCKYWGKRDEQLHLPVTDSLSVGLGKKGAQTRVRFANARQDEIFLNQQSYRSRQWVL